MAGIALLGFTVFRLRLSIDSLFAKGPKCDWHEKGTPGRICIMLLDTLHPTVYY